MRGFCYEEKRGKPKNKPPKDRQLYRLSHQNPHFNQSLRTLILTRKLLCVFSRNDPNVPIDRQLADPNWRETKEWMIQPKKREARREAKVAISTLASPPHAPSMWHISRDIKSLKWFCRLTRLTWTLAEEPEWVACPSSLALLTGQYFSQGSIFFFLLFSTSIASLPFSFHFGTLALCIQKLNVKARPLEASADTVLLDVHLADSPTLSRQANWNWWRTCDIPSTSTCTDAFQTEYCKNPESGIDTHRGSSKRTGSSFKLLATSSCNENERWMTIDNE